MSKAEFTIDYGGARGSNAGDEYHELWTVRQALRLLDDHTQLSALTVEGLRAQDGTGSAWDGVDCALFYEGYTSAEAARVELHQFKYSAAGPESPWTVARLATGRQGKVASSPIRKLANAYKQIVQTRASKPANSLKVVLVTNQPIDDDLIKLIEQARSTVPDTYRRTWSPGDPDLHRLVHASGLPPDTFNSFAQVLDLQGQSGSRFAVEEAMLKSIAEWTDVEFREAASRLREYVRDRMLPESAGEVINREKVLLRFGVSDERALFPCPPAVKQATNPVSRAAAQQVVDRMLAGQQNICFHGGGGVGKTTALQEIGTRLPFGSVMVTFDCYGGGSYMDASALRHRPEDAFLQLSNDLARQLRIPLLLETHGTRDFARAFRRRLNQSASLLLAARPDALLVLAIDAADNSVTAAQHRSPPETTFVHELASFSDLPRNVRLLVSARTGRRNELRLPKTFEHIELSAFDRADTAANVARHWAAPEEWVEDFHELSNGIPRVQAYAFENAGDTPAPAIDTLRPVGKKLDQVFQERFAQALLKAGRPDDLHFVCAGLVALARPIPIQELAAVLRFDEAQIADVCADLAPGVRNEMGLLSFADEDFEAFVRDAAQDALAEVRRRTADRFLERGLTDAYAAFNVAPVLLAAERRKELLDFVEATPEPAADLIRDPVRRKEVHHQRLLTAISVCRAAGNTARALRFVLIGAEAMRTGAATRTLLAAYPELTARYAKETASRLILGDPDLVAEHGALLAELLTESAAKGNAIAVREGMRRLRAWFEARDDAWRKEREKNEHAQAWRITNREGAALLYATLLHHGPKHAVLRIGHFRPWEFALGSGTSLIERLLAERRFDEANALAAALPDAWAVFVLVPLAMAEQPIDYERLERGLRSLSRRFKLNAQAVGYPTREDALGPYVIDTVLSAVEILTAKGTSTEAIRRLLAPFLDPEIRRVDARYDFESHLLDAILRSYCLTEALSGREAKAEDVLTPRPQQTAGFDRERGRSDGEHDQRLREFVSAVAGFYIARAQAIAGVHGGAQFDAAFGNAEKRFANESWRFDRRPWSSAIRAKMAEGLTVLLATGLDAEVILRRALLVRGRGWPDRDSGVARIIGRFTAIPRLHSRLLAEITRIASETRRERTGAEDKSRRLSTYATLLLPISPADADAVFKHAIEVASELDSEAMHQVRFMAGLIERAVTSLGSEAGTLAQKFAEVVRDAAIRLEDVDDFPWQESFRGLALLDIPSALAAAARWDDTSLVSLDRSLAPTVTTGINSGNVTLAQAYALFGLLERASFRQLQSIMAEGGQANALAEELAHDVLTDRTTNSDEVAAFVVRNGTGPWARRFLAQRDFEGTLSRGSQQDETTGTSEKAQHRPSLEFHLWLDGVLIDSERLGDAAEAVVKQARAAAEYISLEDVLNRARRTIAVGLRVPHLDALASLLDRLSSHDVLRVILSAVDEWQGQLAVAEWCRARLPELLATHLRSFALHLPWDRRPLEKALLLSRATDEQAQTVILDGIERNANELGAGATFALAREIAVRLPRAEAAVLCEWYIARLEARIPFDDQERVAPNSVPRDAEDAVARFFHVYLGDIDWRRRWRAAHSLRRLARLGGISTLSKIVQEHGRQVESSFRDANAPFYGLAADLWLVIALGRIASETPAAVASHSRWLADTALSGTFPHLLLREYAADACHALVRSRQLTLSEEQATTLANVNRSTLPLGTKKRRYGRSFDRTQAGRDEEKRRFHFDGLDTLRYWYEPWLDAFEDLDPGAFLEAAERWIVDVWGVKDEEPDGYKDPRASRFEERHWMLADTSHGTLPTMERHRTYLEWHAMWCAAGDILKTHRITKPQYDQENKVQDRIAYDKLSVPDVWLADLVGPRPLEPHRWRPHAGDTDWRCDISDDRVLAELMPPSRKGFIVVDASVHDRWGRHGETVRVNSALVSADTAHALLRALQTVENSHDYYLCPEGDDREIDDPEHKLLGWLKSNSADGGFDRKDVFSNGIRGIECTPGQRISARLGLERRIETGFVHWTRHGEAEPVFIYESWGERESDERRGYGDEESSRGHRLMVHADDLATFLPVDGYDLIVEVEISRRDQKERAAYADDQEEAQDAEFDRVLLLRADGRIEAAERCLGSWQKDRA